MSAERIYLAGPDVFVPDAERVARLKRQLCARYGFEGLVPVDSELRGAAEIFEGNRALMERAEIGVFNLSPFRGPSADAGTVFELGFLSALGKRVYGYSNTRVLYAERVADSYGPVRDERDRDGHVVESFGLADNLMIDMSLRRAGGSIVIVEEDALPALRAFEACLRALRLAADA